MAAALAVSAIIGQAPTASADTVLTLEGGIVGLQPWLHFTPLQLQGDLCQAPNHCQPVNYFAMPLGQKFNDQGAVTLNEAIGALPADGTPIVLYGHSQGGQVIYSALRGWAANPATAPDPARVSWVSIGNPENTFGGKSPDPIPANSPYQGTEVIRQYDGWADWPTDTKNMLAVLNAVVGMQTVHPNYFKVDINDPNNIRYAEGNTTYVFVPNTMLPLVQLTGPLAPLLNPVLDPILRPLVEAGYHRPIDVNTTGTNPAAAVHIPTTTGTVRAAAATKSVAKPAGVKHTRPAAATRHRSPLQ
ncbi:MAG: PE-PPE domain-containing protein [Mycobacterium sp.]